MRRLLILFFALILAADADICGAGPERVSGAANQEQKDAEFRRLFASFFPRWDRNHDGLLDLREFNSVIEDASVHGIEAVAAAVLRRHLPAADGGETNGLTLESMLALASDQQTQRTISQKALHLQTINHSLFLPGDPNLLTFHQGRMGDCYLLAPVASFVYQHPQAVRTMIKPKSGGQIEVNFGNGKIATIEAMTDGEVTLGASEGEDRGVWLSVLEKAYAALRKDTKEERTGEKLEANEAIAADFIGHGGTCGPVMAALTGHKTATARMGSLYKEDPKIAIKTAHDLLSTLSAAHRVMTIGTGGDKTKKLPKGIPHKHALAILTYNPSTRMVRMFNPWGNHVAPAGPPGPVNGYSTEHGIFDVPLEEYIQVFGSVTYETDVVAPH
jgi:hypothetical protein